MSLNTATNTVHTDNRTLTTTHLTSLASYASEFSLAQDLSEELSQIKQSISLLTKKSPIVRGLNRAGSADYIGVSTTKFDELVKSKQMPSPVRIGGRVVWDIHELDEYFDLLKESNQEQANFDEDALLADWP